MTKIENKLVKDWLSGVKPSSGKQYYHHFSRFLDFLGLTADKFLEESKQDKIMIKTRINEWYNHLIDENGKSYSLSYAATSDSAVRSFLIYHEVDLPNLPKRSRSVEYEREPLRKEEIRKLVDAAPHLRDKCLIIMGFQTGMAISDLVRLNYKDVKNAVENDEYPLIIKYRRKKANTKGLAIIGLDSINLLKQFFAWRTENGEQPTKNSPLFIGIHKKNGTKRLAVRSAQDMMRKTIVKAGLATFEELKEYGTFNPWSFHAVRAAFSSIAEQYMPKTCVDYSMGHRLPYNGAYTKYKDEERIGMFKIAEPHLSIYSDIKEHGEQLKKQSDRIEELEEENLNLVQGLQQQSSEIRSLQEQVQEIVSGDATKRLAIDLFAQIFDAEPTEDVELYDEDFAVKKQNLQEKMRKAMSKLLSDE